VNYSGDAHRVERGPAYDATHSRADEAAGDDWPTYRHDGQRSGCTNASLAAELRTGWHADLGGRLSSLTIAAGRVYLSRIDTHTLFALDTESGEIAWSFLAGGPVDSPPTVSGGLLTFGCRDGWVYCLRARDGELAWRFRAGPEDRRTIAFDGLESIWPVHGSVLTRDGLVWFAAGRSSYLDGGIRLFALQQSTGQLVVAKRLDGHDAASWTMPKDARGRPIGDRIPGTLPDILSTRDNLLFMRWTCFNEQGELTGSVSPHLFSATGFLDDSWWHRTYWQYGSWMRGGFGGWPQAARQAPAGRLLVFDDERLFGFGRSQYDVGNPERVHAGHVGLIKDGYQDSGRIDLTQNPYRLFATQKPTTAKRATTKTNAGESGWQTIVPLLVRAMLLADKTLFIAGPDSGINNQRLSDLRAVQPGSLCAVSASDGSVLETLELPAAPVLDGMAAVNGRLVLACGDGVVRCFVE
jgi:hypothetical protein